MSDEGWLLSNALGTQHLSIQNQTAPLPEIAVADALRVRNRENVLRSHCVESFASCSTMDEGDTLAIYICSSPRFTAVGCVL